MKLQKILSLLVTQILIFLTLIVIGQRPAIAAVKIVTTVNGSVITNYQIDQRSTFLE